VAPLTAVRESALTVALHPANLVVSASGSGVSEVSAVPKQMSENLQVQVDPGSDTGLAAVKETAHTSTSATVRQDAVETRDAGDIRELEEPLVIHAQSDVEDSTPPVAKSKACSRGQKEVVHASHARGSVKSTVFSRQTSGHQHSSGKRHQGFSEANAYFFQKRFCAPQQRGRSPPRSSRPPYRSHRVDKVTSSAQDYEEFLRLRRHAAYRK